MKSKTQFIKEVDDLLARLCDSVVDSGEITPAEILEKYPAIAAKYETEKANDVDGGEHKPGKDVILKTKDGLVYAGRGIADDDGFYFAVLAVNGGVTHIDPDRVAKWVYAEDAFDLLI